MTDSLVPRIKDVMALAFNTAPADIPDDAMIGDTPGWDSLGHANLVLALEEAFEVEISQDDVVDLQSLSDIANYLAARQVA